MRHLNLFSTLVLLFSLLFSTLSFASGQKLVNGAGTIPSKSVGISFNGGLEVPEPFFYGLRFDFGIGDRIQLGFGGSITGIINTGAVYSMFNVWKSGSESDFLSFYLNPFVVNLSGAGFDGDSGDSGFVNVILVQPGVAYEHRFGQNRNLGLYFKVGSIIALMATANGKSALIPMTTDTVIINLIPGIQKNFGGSFAISAEPYLLVPINHRHDVKWNAGPIGLGGKLGLSWVF